MKLEVFNLLDLNFPAHWQLKKFKHIFKFISETGYSDRELLSVFLDRGVIKYSANNAKPVHKPSENLSNYQLVQPGDLVLNNQQAWRGSVGVSEYEGIVSPAYYVLRPTILINAKFLNYVARDMFVVGQFKMASKGVGSIQRQIYVPYLKNIFLPLPPIDEQEKIVRYLDKKTSAAQKIIDAKTKQVELLAELKRSIISNAVTHGIFSDKTPDTWQNVKLFQIATEQKISNKNVHNQNLLSLSYGKIKRKNINSTNGLLPANFDNYQIVHDGNIILRLTDLQNDHRSLRVGLVTETGIITAAYLCLKILGNNYPKFLYYVLHNYDIAKKFYGMGSGVRQSLNYKDISRLKFFLPPLWEQKEIADFLDWKCGKIENLISALKKEIELYKELQKSLIAEVVTGKIDVRELI